jgi:glyoxylase-like metal-dependent hydrolase (beta-lactamase superfamily II)/ferredoxin
MLMADAGKRLPQNVAGEFFVDSSCIDCDACRQIAPATFHDHGEQSSVYQQPRTLDEEQRALMALVACPTASIGTEDKRSARRGRDAFPERIAENIFFNGFTAENSFGAWSYIIQRPQTEGGNVLVDSPRYSSYLVERWRAMGGAGLMFLSHRDDIADHARYAAQFGCARVMHADDGAARLGVERVIEGEEPVQLGPELLAIPTPGHTRGHMVLLHRQKFLFTGDHLAWSPARQTLTAFRDACWYSWPRQIRSMERLLDYGFEWVLPGHGRIAHAPAGEMHSHLQRCIAWMKTLA